MFAIDPLLLLDLRLGQMTAGDRDRLMAQLTATLQKRVGETIISKMSPQQLAEFENMTGEYSQEQINQWLEQNFPNYQAVVRDELVILKGEIINGGGIIDPVTPSDLAVTPAPQQPPSESVNQQPEITPSPQPAVQAQPQAAPVATQPLQPAQPQPAAPQPQPPTQPPTPQPQATTSQPAPGSTINPSDPA